ncbi:MAG: glycosyltransferase family A protein, partial [Nitrospiraceae bacterium]|nr:glycosyltransferase family A protein [Nitrospiraceae bacterium]
MNRPHDKSLSLVTVIITCYNSEKFIKQTIDSALSQTYKNVDVIAVDDGSTDTTRQILDSYQERIRVLEHPNGANRGQWASANLAMRQSGSDYVALLDHDDIWAPAKIERQVNFLDGRPDVGLVYSNGYSID